VTDPAPAFSRFRHFERFRAGPSSIRSGALLVRRIVRCRYEPAGDRAASCFQAVGRYCAGRCDVGCVVGAAEIAGVSGPIGEARLARFFLSSNDG
jgi:hypothetical protein